MVQRDYRQCEFDPDMCTVWFRTLLRLVLCDWGAELVHSWATGYITTPCPRHGFAVILCHLKVSGDAQPAVSEAWKIIKACRDLILM